MTLTDTVLVLCIVALLGWAIYDEVILDRLKGKTQLAVPLLRRGRADSLIFVGLLAILIYNNFTAQGAMLTTWLLGGLALVAIYLFWFRIPVVRFKATGLYFAGSWTEYNHIKAMNLSEDGVLVMELAQRRLLLRVKNIDDLERIYKFMVNTQ